MSSLHVRVQINDDTDAKAFIASYVGNEYAYLFTGILPEQRLA